MNAAGLFLTALLATSSLSLSFVSPAGRPAALAGNNAPRISMLLGDFTSFAAAHIVGTSEIDADRLRVNANQPAISWQLLSKTEVKEGFYGEYSVEVKEQERDNAESTFKSKEATEKGKNKYTSVLAILLVGSFVIPMVQYWWYIRDEDKEYD